MMAIHVRDAETDRVVRQLAEIKGTSLTETIRNACDEAFKNSVKTMTKAERFARMRAIVDQLNKTHPVDESVVIDKAFFDALNDE